jgi:DNA-binding FadR family transcriptional regulator
MNAKNPTSRNTFQRQVLDQLGLDICSRRFAAGSIFPPEVELCERFSFSRIVIREAIKSLAAKGMLEVRRKVGTLVLPSSRWNLFDPDIIAWRAQASAGDQQMNRDLMGLRRIVEPAAARLAAARATADERRVIAEAFAAMEQAVIGGGDYVQADLTFHCAILDSCHNQFVSQMHNAISMILNVSFGVLALKPGGPALSLPTHRDLCRAIESGDENGAERAALSLIDQAEKDLELHYSTSRAV